MYLHWSVFVQGLISFDNLTVRPDKKGEVLDEMQLEDVVQGHMLPPSLSSSLSRLLSLSLSLSTIVVNIVHNVLNYIFQEEHVSCSFMQPLWWVLKMRRRKHSPSPYVETISPYQCWTCTLYVATNVN